MPAKKMKEFLDQRGIRYVSVQHSPAFTAPEIAASAHISGSNFGKTVIVRIERQLAMVVLPAHRKIVLSDLRDMLGTSHVTLASEAEFADQFSDCEVGAMPPLGNLYGLPVYVDQRLADEDEIAFNAGTHREVIKMSFADFAELVRPVIVELATA